MIQIVVTRTSFDEYTYVLALDAMKMHDISKRIRLPINLPVVFQRNYVNFSGKMLI